MKTADKASWKIIITGEHFVVHGGYDLNAAVGEGVQYEATHSAEKGLIFRPINMQSVLASKVPSRFHTSRTTLMHHEEKGGYD